MVLLKSKKTPNQVDQDFVIAGKTLSQLKKDLQAEKEHYKKFGLWKTNPHHVENLQEAIKNFLNPQSTPPGKSQSSQHLTQKELKQVYDIVVRDLFNCFQQMEIGQSVKLGALGAFKKTAREFDLVDSDGQRHTGSYYHFGFKMFKSVRQQLQD